MENYAFVVALAVVLNLLLIPTYHSTDFEVHRNWLAITHSLPVKQWYTDATSQWTLDYPPLFPWMEFALSQIAKFVDPLMLKVDNLNYSSKATVAFQRISVIVLDFVYYIAVAKLWLFWSTRVGKMNSSMALWCELSFGFLFVFNYHLLLVDHIHFQYNGFLTGIFLLSVAAILQDQPLRGAFWFSVLLNLKHIYLYVAPAYFVYLLRHYCLQGFTRQSWPIVQFLKRLLSLGGIVVAVFGVSFGPFLYYGQLGQVLSRLFPFQRGLCHAYWAPNAWALYNVADKLLQRVLKMPALEQSAMTGGLVKEFRHVVLPSVTPVATFVLTLLAMLPVLYTLWTTERSTKRTFLLSVVMCSWSAFLFGWHVHEKAVILIIIPLMLLATFDRHISDVAMVVNVVGGYSLFPLIFTQQETGIKTVLFLLTMGLSWRALHILHLQTQANTVKVKRKTDTHSPERGQQKGLLNLVKDAVGPISSLYLVALPVLMLYVGVGHEWIYREEMPFLPLLLTSVYCAVPLCCGFCYCLMKSSHGLLTFGSARKVKTQ